MTCLLLNAHCVCVDPTRILCINRLSLYNTSPFGQWISCFCFSSSFFFFLLFFFFLSLLLHTLYLGKNKEDSERVLFLVVCLLVGFVRKMFMQQLLLQLIHMMYSKIADWAAGCATSIIRDGKRWARTEGIYTQLLQSSFIQCRQNVPKNSIPKSNRTVSKER